MEGPLSSYSSFEMHFAAKVDKLANMEPPIKAERLRSGGAMTWNLHEGGATASISIVRRSLMPGNMVLPPASTMLEYISSLISVSHLMSESFSK